MDQEIGRITLGRGSLQVGKVCLGTMTFGEQVGEADTHALLDHALERGIDFLDTAEMYSSPPRRETYGLTETFLGTWFASRPGARKTGRPGRLRQRASSSGGIGRWTRRR